MDKVFETLKPDRGLVLLRSRTTGELEPAVVRVAEGISAEDIRLSRPSWRRSSRSATASC
jgi:hypothetical protein